MRRCCVPYCSSTRKKKEKLGFYELPSNFQQRISWQIAISQVVSKDKFLWEHKERSVVCEKHFKGTDFRTPSFKCRKLLPGVVPSIFEKSPPENMETNLASKDIKCNERTSLNETNNISTISSQSKKMNPGECNLTNNK